MKQLVLPVAAALAMLACSPPTAEDLVREVVEQRNNYDATLQSWIEREDGSLYLDVLVVNNNVESTLRTLTVLIEQLDTADAVLASSRVPVQVGELTPGMGQSLGVTVPQARPGVEGIRLLIESNPGADVWPELPELDAVRPRA